MPKRLGCTVVEGQVIAFLHGKPDVLFSGLLAHFSGHNENVLLAPACIKSSMVSLMNCHIYLAVLWMGAYLHRQHGSNSGHLLATAKGTRREQLRGRSQAKKWPHILNESTDHCLTLSVVRMKLPFCSASGQRGTQPSASPTAASVGLARPVHLVRTTTAWYQHVGTPQRRSVHTISC